MNDVGPGQTPRPEEPPPPRGQRAADPRHRALLGLLIALLLVVLGLVLVKVLGDAGRMQDCVLSGRSNCAPIDTTPAQ